MIAVKYLFLATVLGAICTLCTVRIKASPSSPTKFDEFDYISCEDFIARLDAYAINLQRDPTLRAYAIVYGKQLGRRGEVRLLNEMLNLYLTKVRAMEPQRIYTVDGGYREKMYVELWFLPIGASPPKATPTINANSVRFKGRVGKRWFSYTGDFCNGG